MDFGFRISDFGFSNINFDVQASINAILSPKVSPDNRSEGKQEASAKKIRPRFEALSLKAQAPKPKSEIPNPKSNCGDFAGAAKPTRRERPELPKKRRIYAISRGTRVATEIGGGQKKAKASADKLGKVIYMKTKLFLSLALTTTVLGGSAWAAPKSKITLEQAQEIALRRVGGEIEQADTVTRRKRPEYSFFIRESTGVTTHVLVDEKGRVKRLADETPATARIK